MTLQAGRPTAAPAVAATDADPAQSQDQAQDPATGVPATDPFAAGEPRSVAAFTRKSQTVAAVAQVLGIGKDASPAEFVAAIEAFRQEQAVADPESFEDPRQVARAKELDRQAWHIAEQQYGPDMVTAAKNFYDTVRTNRDPIALVRAMNAAAFDAAAILNGAQSPEDQAQPAAVPQQRQGAVVPDLGTQPPRGQVPPSTIDTDDFKGNPVGFLRAMFGGG